MLREAAASVVQENLGIGRCPGTPKHEVGRSIAIEVRKDARGETALRHLVAFGSGSGETCLKTWLTLRRTTGPDQRAGPAQD